MRWKSPYDFVTSLRSRFHSEVHRAVKRSWPEDCSDIDCAINMLIAVSRRGSELILSILKQDQTQWCNELLCSPPPRSVFVTMFRAFVARRNRLAASKARCPPGGVLGDLFGEAVERRP